MAALQAEAPACSDVAATLRSGATVVLLQGETDEGESLECVCVSYIDALPWLIVYLSRRRNNREGSERAVPQW